MNPIALAMDGLLAGLLVFALVMGWRLNGRLKALRESHIGFAKAVSELDAAASKADAALKALQASSETAHDELLARIETARSLVARIEKAGEAAERAAQRAETATAAAAAASAARASETPARASAPRRPLSDLLAAYEGRIEETAAEAKPSPKSLPPRPAPRRRPLADEELFAEAEAGVRPGLAGLMRLSLARSK
jgi:hypothetical protein